ncbi:MAG: head-tail connector protein [Rhodospirillales bacterium]|nr:head-tail connector protein [Rhodospirillales bacterium]
MAVTAPPLATIKTALRVDENDDDDRLTQIAAAAAERANRQAPDAPEHIAREAMLRYIGWLYEGPSHDAGFDVSGAWRKCGAKGMLSPWTVRRAGILKAPG